tara:strand:- start:644 stop:769 length:126 start_codon:yes stop_codon:yes gene_type:complete
LRAAGELAVARVSGSGLLVGEAGVVSAENEVSSVVVFRGSE